MPFSQLVPQQAGMGGEAHLPELEQQHRQAGGFQDYDSQMSFIVKKKPGHSHRGEAGRHCGQP